MTHKELVDIAYKWVLNNTSCGVAFKELNCASNGEIPDVIGFSSWQTSILLECKLSRNDFLGDSQKPFRKNPEKGMGRYRFFICPAGLIKPEELPNKWGLIYVNEKGKAKMVVNPYGQATKYKKSSTYNIRDNGHEYNLKAEHQFLYSVARRFFIRGMMPEVYKDAPKVNIENNYEDNETSGSNQNIGSQTQGAV